MERMRRGTGALAAVPTDVFFFMSAISYYTVVQEKDTDAVPGRDSQNEATHRRDLVGGFVAVSDRSGDDNEPMVLAYCRCRLAIIHSHCDSAPLRQSVAAVA